jgi:membrane protease subunit HflK
MPGGMGSGRSIALLVLAGIALWAVSGFFRVQPDEQGVVLQFGKWDRTVGPGLNYHLPSPIEVAFTPKVTTVNRIEFGFRSAGEARGGVTRDIPEESLMLTGDQNIVDIDFTVFWRIKDAGQYLFNIRNPEATVKIAAESVMREVIGQNPIQAAFTEGRQQIEERTFRGVQRLLDSYGAGIEIRRVQLQKADPPQPVIDAFIDVQRARQDEERAKNEAEAYRNDILPRARGDAEKIIQDARGYKEAVVNRADGDAQRFLKVLEAYSVAKTVTMQRLYLETLEDVFQGMNKIVIDSSEGGTGVVPYLPLQELRARGSPEPREPGSTTSAPVTSGSSPQGTGVGR